MLMSQANPLLLLGLPHDHGHHLPSYFGEELSPETHLSLITLLMNLRTSAKSREESVRVMYEDPGQRDEKKRLISLLKNQGGGEEDLLVSSGGFEKRAKRSSLGHLT